MKLTKRKGFNFFRSYYDVYNELSDKDKIAFMDALLDREFLGIKPTNLKGMAKFAYISQTNSIDSQIKGYEDKTGNKLCLHPPTVGGRQGGNEPPTAQEKGKGEVKEKEKVKDIYIPPFEEFKTYGLSKEPNLEIQGLKFKYEAWKENGWKNGFDKPIKNWKTTLLNTIPHLKKKIVTSGLDMNSPIL